MNELDLGAGARTHVRAYGPVRESDGRAVMWRRAIAGTVYEFSLVTMPDGERRVFASRFNGYPGGPRFACAWDRAAEMTFKADGSTRNRRYPPRTDHSWLPRKRSARVR